jgi:hypothetical protein
LPTLLYFIGGKNERSGHLSQANLKNCSALKKINKKPTHNNNNNNNNKDLSNS